MKKKRKTTMYNRKCISALLGVILMTALYGCTEKSADDKPTESEVGLFAMDTYMSLKAYGPNADKSLQNASERITQLESLLSVTDSGSEIYRLNNAEGKETPLSPETGFLIRSSLEFGSETNGAFDITLYPVSKEWGFTTGSYKVPSEERIKELLEKTGSDNISLSNDGSGALLKNGANIDLGGIAKGYAGSCAAEILKDDGIESAILNMGGNVQTVGTKPDGNAWKVGIQDPEDSSKLVGMVSVADKAVVTSGGYERYFEDDDGNIYWHILDPKTGYPAQSDIISVTVIGSDGTICDALSTSLFVMGTEGASAYLKNHSELGAVIVSRDRKLYITENIRDNFKSSGDFAGCEIIII